MEATPRTPFPLGSLALPRLGVGLVGPAIRASASVQNFGAACLQDLTQLQLNLKVLILPCVLHEAHSLIIHADVGKTHPHGVAVACTETKPVQSFVFLLELFRVL